MAIALHIAHAETATLNLNDSMEHMSGTRERRAMTDPAQMFATRLVLVPGQPRIPIPNWPCGTRDGLDAVPGECELELTAGAIPPLAAHVVTSRIGYSHHGIHVGNGRVVHYSGLSRGWRGGPVEEVPLAEFARGRPVRVRVHVGARFDSAAVVARARSRLGEKRYRALSNNCEHLCEWCIYGENRSRQVEVMRCRSLRVFRAVSRLVAAPVRVFSLLAAYTKMSSGRSADTMKFGTSTSSATRRSTATLQIA